MRRIGGNLELPLLPPADYMAPVPLKRKRDTSVEPKTDPLKRTYMRIPDEAKLWFQDFHSYQARVHGKSLTYNIRGAKHLLPDLFGSVAADTFRRWPDGDTPDHRGRPPVDLPPFALSRASRDPHTCRRRPGSVSALPLGSTSTAVCCASSTSNPSTADDGRGSSYSSLQLSWKLAAACTRHRPSEADIARERKLLQLRVIYLCDRFKISQDRIWNLDETAVRMVPAGERGWTKTAEPAYAFALARLRHGHARCEHEGRHVDADRL